MKIKEHVRNMTNIRKMIAFGAVLAMATVGAYALADDELDLDAMLGELGEGDTAVTAQAPAAQAAAASEAAPAESEVASEDAAKVGEESAENAEEATEAERLSEGDDLDGIMPPTEVAPTAAVSPEEEAELIANIRATEEIRRKAFDLQAMREIKEARAAMSAEEFQDAALHYNNALKLLADGASSRNRRRECTQGIAESVYRLAMQEERVGRHDRAVEFMNKAVDLRHPKARRQLQAWNSASSIKPERLERSEVSHRRNDESYKLQSEKNRKHLRRARQLMSTRELDKAVDECELVLVDDPYNQEAISLRDAIEKKRQYILDDEFTATRDGMIADVDAAWRPVYAPNARSIEEVSAHTVKREVGEDPERAVEQTIIKRMKEMRLPAISFKPPATIIDAVEFFRGASRDFGDPNLPIEQRGFNFVLKTLDDVQLANQAAKAGADDSDDFSDTGDDESEEAAAGVTGVPVIPMITASDISFYEALKLVCDSVHYKFKVQGTIVMVMHEDISTDEMVTRSYPVLAQFINRMDSASSDIKEMKSFGNFGDSRAGGRRKTEESEGQQQDWKEFFSLLGVQWPEGSSILYIKTIGKLRVRNTYENLAELEKALTELNVDQKLIEIETRFVEVCQEDLNSLGFEWILNSDYSLGVNNWLGKGLGINNGQFAGSVQEVKTLTGYETSISTVGGTTTQTLTPQYNTTTTRVPTHGSAWERGAGTERNIGINSFGENSGYGTTLRHLNTVGNHVAGTSTSYNDQLVRINAFLGSADLSMILHMLSQRSDTDLLSAPKVLTKPGEEAVMKVVTEYIYPTDYEVSLSSSSSGGNSGYSSGSSQQIAIVEPQSFTMREVGVILDVTPTLTDDGNLIDLKLDTKVVDEPTWHNYGMKIPVSGNTALQNFSGIGEIMTGLGSIFTTFGSKIPDSLIASLTGQVTDSATTALENISRSDSNIEYYDVPMEQPFFHVRSIESNISIYPGATIVMGGLITESRVAMDDKIPILGDLPFIGRLFRSHAEKTNKRNLLIFVTTRLVDVRGREVTIGTEQGKDAAEVVSAPTQK